MFKSLKSWFVFLLLFSTVLPAVLSGCGSVSSLPGQIRTDTGPTAASPEPPDSSEEPFSVWEPENSQYPGADQEPENTKMVGETPEPEISLIPDVTPEPKNSPPPIKTSEPKKTEKPVKNQSPTPNEKSNSTSASKPEPTPKPTPAVEASLFYRLEVDVTNQVVSAYEKDKDGKYTKLVRQMICSTGKSSTPTPLGSFAIPGGPYDRGLWGYFTKFKVWARYFVRIKGGILFHSVIYAKNDVTTLKQSTVNTLGTPVSAGCIRLQVEDAKWIYDHVKAGTFVDVVEKEKNPELTASLKPGTPAKSPMPSEPAETPPPVETVPVSLSLDNPDKIRLMAGESVPWKAIVTYSDKTEKEETANAERSLDKEGIVVLQENTILGIAPGTAVLTVKCKDLSASVEITVVEAAPTESSDPPTEPEESTEPVEESGTGTSTGLDEAEKSTTPAKQESGSLMPSEPTKSPAGFATGS